MERWNDWGGHTERLEGEGEEWQALEDDGLSSGVLI